MRNPAAKNLEDRRYAPKKICDRRWQADLDAAAQAVEEFGEDYLEQYAEARRKA